MVSNRWMILENVKIRTRSRASLRVSVAIVPALKEWAPVVTALGRGEQTILLRKGGIKERRFVPQSKHFLLFPTAFHTDQTLLKPTATSEAYAADWQFDPKSLPSLAFPLLASVSGAWTTMDPRVLEALNSLHIYGPNFLETRLKWRAAQPLTVVEVRVSRLHVPVESLANDDYWGCFSWVDVPSERSVAELLAQSNPVLDDASFSTLQDVCRSQNDIQLTPIEGFE